MNGETTRKTYVIGQTELTARPLETALYLVATPIGNARLRATPAGMIVLDAVVADLAR